jgi:hypothetical protein
LAIAPEKLRLELEVSVSDELRMQLLELDVDTRTAHVWAELEPALRRDNLTVGILAAAIRAAYAQGYADCLKDEGVTLYADHGYRIEKR